MMLGKIAVLVLVGRDRHADRRGDQSVRLVGALTVIDAENDFTGTEKLDAFFPGDALAKRRIDAGDENEIAIGQSGRSQSQLEGRELFLVNAHPFGKKTFFRNHCQRL